MDQEHNGTDFDDCSGGDFIIDAGLIGEIQKNAPYVQPYADVKGRTMRIFKIEAPTGKLIGFCCKKIPDPQGNGFRFQLTLTLKDATEA